LLPLIQGEAVRQPLIGDRNRAGIRLLLDFPARTGSKRKQRNGNNGK
jgi:hypothetical protein